jgi:small-conductance mechanosensitive channel/CRP-like cAMP-binding protein
MIESLTQFMLGDLMTWSFMAQASVDGMGLPSWGNVVDWFDTSKGRPTWHLWGLVLLIAHPVLVVLLGEAAHFAERSSRPEFGRPLILIRNGVLASLFVVIMLRFVIVLDPTHLLVKIADTIFWILVINAGLSFFNVFFFHDSETEGWRGRMPKLFLDLLRVFFGLFGAAIVVSTIWNVNLGGLMTALGVGSVVIGLALQDTLGALVSGIAMLSTKFFKIGDWISVDGLEGRVTEMTWRAVKVRTREGDSISLPNTTLAKEKVTNYADALGYHLEFVDLNLSYTHPPEDVKDAIIRAAEATPFVLKEPKTMVRLKAYDEFSVNYMAMIPVADYKRIPLVRSEFQSIFWYMAEREGFVFPARHSRLYREHLNFQKPVEKSPNALSHLIAQLKTFPLTADQIEPLVRNATIERFRLGEVLIERGRPARGLFIVVEGEAHSFNDAGTTPSSKPNEPVHVHEFTSGQMIAFKSLFRDEMAPFMVKAQSNVSVILIPSHDFRDFLADNPKLAKETETVISARDVVENRGGVSALSGRAEDGASDREEALRRMFPN